MATETTVVVKLTGESSGLQKAIDNVDKELGQLVRQTDRAQAALGKGLGKGAQQATAGLKKASGAMNQYSAAQNATMKNAGRLRAQYQNLGYQLQDTVVQLEMGTHWTRVLGQQGSQVAGIFGNPWITIMAAAAGAVLALATGMGIFKGEAIDLTKTVDDLAESMGDFTDAKNDALDFSFGGTDNPFLAQVLSGQLDDKLKQLSRSLKGTGGTIGDVFGDLNGGMIGKGIGDRLDDLDQQIDSFMAGIGMMGVPAIQASVDNFEDKFGMTVQHARNIKEAIEAFASGEGLHAAQRNAASLEAQLRPVKDSSEEMYSLWQQALRVLQLTTQEIGRQDEAITKASDAAADWFKEIRAAYEEITKVSVEGPNFQPMTEAARALADASSQAASEFETAMKNADGLKEALGDSLFEALRLQGVDLTTGVGKAADAAATLARNLGISLAAAQQMVDIATAPNAFMKYLAETGGPAGGKPGEGMTQDRMNKILGVGKYATKPSRGGGASREQEDALEKLRNEYQLKLDLLETDQARSLIMEKLGDDANKYTEQQIAGVEQLIEEYEKQKQVLDEQAAMWDTVGSTFEDGFLSIIDGTESVEDAFRSMAQAILKELFRVYVLQKLIGSVGGGGIIGALTPNAQGNVTPNAQGNVISGGAVTPFAHGGVVSGPTLFPMASGTGLMGEEGAEAIMPLSRKSNGDLGVAGPAVTINNYTGQEVSVDRTEEMITIAVGRARQAVAGDFSKSMSTGQGTYARAVEGGYGSRRRY